MKLKTSRKNTRSSATIQTNTKKRLKDVKVPLPGKHSQTETLGDDLVMHEGAVSHGEGRSHCPIPLAPSA